MKSGADFRRLFWPIAVGWLILDFVTKRMAEGSLRAFPPVQIIGDWIQLRLVYNQGAAFGLHLGPFSRWIFLAIAILAIGFVVRMARQSEPGDLLRQIAAALVTAGAAGNAIDRIRGVAGVVDFIDVGVGATRWPTFNVADIGVSCGAVALAISFWLEDSRRARAAAASSTG